MRSLLKFQVSMEMAAGTGTVLRPMKDLLARYYACRHSRNRWPRGEQEIAICTVDVERCCPCELVSGAIQGDGFNGFYEARKLHGWTASYAASQVKRGGGELVVTCMNPLAVPGGHKFGTRRPRGYDNAPRRDQTTVVQEGRQKWC